MRPAEVAAALVAFPFFYSLRWDSASRHDHPSRGGGAKLDNTIQHSYAEALSFVVKNVKDIGAKQRNVRRFALEKRVQLHGDFQSFPVLVLAVDVGGSLRIGQRAFTFGHNFKDRGGLAIMQSENARLFDVSHHEHLSGLGHPHLFTAREYGIVLESGRF